MRSLLVLVSFTLASQSAASTKFTLKSTDVKPGGQLTEQQVFNGFGCSGANLSPQLSWEGVPAGTKSFVVTVYDPDAPTGSGWWHWVLYDLPATVAELPRGVGSGKSPLPEGAVQGRTDFGAPGFGGACPPPGAKPHRYVFTIYAPKVDKLDVPADASPAMVSFMSRANALGAATFTAHYARKE